MYITQGPSKSEDPQVVQVGQLQQPNRNRQDDWVDLLPTAEFVINSRLNSATGAMPFELLYGYTPDFTIPAGHPTGIPTLDKCLQHLCLVCKDAEAALGLSKKRMQTDVEQ